MSSSENLIKATLNRLTVRIGKEILNQASEIALKAKDAPDRLKEEWNLLKNEIINEATRLDQEGNEEDKGTTNSSIFNEDCKKDPDMKIEQLRRKISQLTRNFEGID
ncbi:MULTISPECIES: hypothetical protein [Prochlorococcus]|uniref:hypothetical protein n=1 Tax=Prochlorococcus TaxID=1218 RepID=UPI000533AA4D|nr:MULTISPECIES: hypothetical protein [Prochlorococcus]KGG13160.1 hypothetical protein EV05_0838 [Prochlorococcus sp. MIT 0601]